MGRWGTRATSSPPPGTCYACERQRPDLVHQIHEGCLYTQNEYSGHFVDTRREVAMSPTQPMRPIEFLVLAVLSEQTRHGYGIVQEINRRTRGRVEVKPGNLYRVIDRLMQRGLVDEDERRPAKDLDNQRRRYYTITESGGRALTEEARMLGAIVDGVRATFPDETPETAR